LTAGISPDNEIIQLDKASLVANDRGRDRAREKRDQAK
jgi:hypothetical protein